LSALEKMMGFWNKVAGAIPDKPVQDRSAEIARERRAEQREQERQEEQRAQQREQQRNDRRR
jgi:hypothetical protein